MTMFTYREHARNEIRHYAGKITNRSGQDAPLAALIAPGPPGIGKTAASLELLADNGVGRLVSPSHEQAKERRAETHKLLKDTNRTNIVSRHMVGLGRKCLYLPEDQWAATGWNFGTVACVQCPSKQQCPGIRQHWQHTDIHLGVHSMANWTKPGVLIIDELPSPVDTRIYSSTELARIGANVWHPALEGWRQGFMHAWNRVLNRLEDFLVQCPTPKVWGTTVHLDNLFPVGSPERADLDFLCDYFEASPVPAPPASSVRAGTITPEKWIAGDVGDFVRLLRWESDSVLTPAREAMGMPWTLCARVYGDNKGRFTDYRIETRRRWTPPNGSHMILDSTAPMSLEIYQKLYPSHTLETSFNVVPLPTANLELVQYDTLGFARSRTLTLSKSLLKPGTYARIRAVRKLIYKIRQLRPSRFQKVKVGIIDHKAFLEAIGYDFHNEAVLTSGNNRRLNPAPDKLLQDAWNELESMADLVVGYHGGVTGSNLFNHVRILAVMGDPTGHIGMLAEEARTMGMDSGVYFRWSVAVNATQEIFRARLLDATPATPKTVLYFGRHAPDLSAMGASWEDGMWADGGRLPSPAAHAFEGAIWEQVGLQAYPIIGVLLPEFASMHATLIGSALYALRASEETWDQSSPKTRECYRRVAHSVAMNLGFHTYHVPHPLGNRKPIPVYARTLAEAHSALAEVQEFLLSTPTWRLKDIQDVALKAEEQRDADEKLMAQVDAIRASVAEAQAEYRDAVQVASMKAAAATTHIDVVDESSWAEVDNLSATLEQTKAALRAEYRAKLGVQVAKWRSIKKEYKSTRSLLTMPEDVLKFAHKGIVL